LFLSPPPVDAVKNIGSDAAATSKIRKRFVLRYLARRDVLVFRRLKNPLKITALLFSVMIIPVIVMMFKQVKDERCFRGENDCFPNRRSTEIYQ